MNLHTFLRESEQSHAREEILNHKLLFDLKLAAGSCGYHLQNYYSDVDHDGFDLILDDAVNLRKIQLKSVGHNATTSKWEINRGLLRPMASNLESLGFQLTSPQLDGGKICWGAEGGVILITYKVDKNNVLVTYRYTDIYIITAISLGILRRGAPTIKCANALRKLLPVGESTEKLEVNKGLFIKVSSPEHLLCLAGMKSAIPRNWHFRVRALASEQWGPKQQMLPSSLDEFRKGFPDIMKEVTGLDSP
jgi:hypothetical protein